jgi:hypothetical protein
MGEIIFWTIIRCAIVIPSMWMLKSYLDYQVWWYAVLMAFYGIVVHPAMIHYKLFEERNKEVIESTLCSSCKYFDKSAVLCMKLDRHPSKDYLPCAGFDWEPASSEVSESSDIM